MLRAENLVKRFEDKTALDGLNTEIRRGCIYGLVGPNGSGKSTLMRLMCGVYRPDGGRVTLEGEDIFENIAAKDRILYLSDDLYFPPKSTVEDLASFYRGLYSGFSMETYHTLCGCFPLQTDQPLSTFSKGMRRQAALLAALCCHADYLLLDEAFDGLDPVIRLMVKKLLAEEIAERGATVMISSHNLRELEDLCDATGFHKTALTETDYDTAALVAALRLDMLAEKAMDYYDQERRTVCYLYLESELDEKYSHQPAEKDFYSSFTVPVGESYTHTLELLREWGLEGYLIPAEWDSMFVTAWGCDVVGTGRVILPLWYGVETEIFSQAAYEAGILLSREEAEPLLALADWTYPNTGSDDCLYLSLVRTAADGTKTYGLPMFLPLEEARRQPLLREYMAEQYGEKLSTPETVDVEALEAR